MSTVSRTCPVSPVSGHLPASQTRGDLKIRQSGPIGYLPTSRLCGSGWRDRYMDRRITVTMYTWKMNVFVGGWICGRVNEWLHGWMHACMDRYMDKCMTATMYTSKMNGSGGLMGGWIHEWVSG